ncbi:class I SAM-dependent methyltransferase [Aliikangiella marina]|uniref:class I SAM-dependent methyltransferase n=1 Tax=Aliikangiella marina TaxID=1712262 RepID=UPI00163D4DE1|nr:class I SAM-dependent methyltransferase [Aliikangiella marina]
MNKDLKKDSWKAYWDTGATESCLGGQGGYSGIIKETWLAFFESFEDTSMSLLDVATGSGAIANIALEARKNCKAETKILGIDASSITSDRKTTDNVSFELRGDSPVESFQFEENEFNVITSQYGIEYSDWSKAIARISNLLASAGRGLFVCHTQNSFVKQRVQLQLNQAKEIKQSKIFNLAQDFVKVILRGTSDIKSHKAFDNADRRLRSAFTKLNKKLESDNDNILLAETLKALDMFLAQMNKFGPKVTLERLENAEQALQFNIIRLKDFLDSILSDESQKALIECLKNNQLEIVSIKELEQNAHNVGTAIEFKKVV